MKQCDGCRFCCWSFNIPDIPNEIQGLTFKTALNHCEFECKNGCSIHERKDYPQICKEFVCPYLTGKAIHRPDTFQTLIKELNPTVGNYIPNIPVSVPIEKAKDLIKETRAIPAFITIRDTWAEVIVSMDREPDKSWSITKEVFGKWKDFLQQYGETTNEEMEKSSGVKMVNFDQVAEYL